jgi:hypothetical protein
LDHVTLTPPSQPWVMHPSNNLLLESDITINFNLSNMEADHISKKTKTTPEHCRIIEICELINSHQLTPKKFIVALLTNMHPTVIDRWKKWAYSGLDSTFDLMKELKTLITKSPNGSRAWEKYVQEEVHCSTFLFYFTCLKLS